MPSFARRCQISAGLPPTLSSDLCHVAERGTEHLHIVPGGLRIFVVQHVLAISTTHSGFIDSLGIRLVELAVNIRRSLAVLSHSSVQWSLGGYMELDERRAY
jgi:hypothetical protein